MACETMTDRTLLHALEPGKPERPVRLLKIIDAASWYLPGPEFRHPEDHDSRTGVYGLGDATLNGRELAVVGLLTDTSSRC